MKKFFFEILTFFTGKKVIACKNMLLLLYEAAFIPTKTFLTKIVVQNYRTNKI